MSTEQTEKVLFFTKNYVVPFLVAVVTFTIAWTTVNHRLDINTNTIESFDKRLVFLEACYRDSSDRLVRIETNIEHITKIIDKEYNGK